MTSYISHRGIPLPEKITPQETLNQHEDPTLQQISPSAVQKDSGQSAPFSSVEDEENSGDHDLTLEQMCFRELSP